MSLISAKNISVRRGKAPVLQNVTLEINAGEIVTIVGPNGSGKSTLLRAFSGAEQPYQGTLTRKDNLRIGYVPQNCTSMRPCP